VDLADFSDRYGGFYAPAFAVRVGGQDLTHSLAIGVSQVEADLTLGAPGRFSFTVVDTYDLESRAFLSGTGQPVLDLLKFGAQVEIAFGYGDYTRLTPIITGLITEITTGFAEGGTPDLAVAGYDYLWPMTLGKRSQSWSQQSDSDTVATLAKEHGLGGGNIESTKEVHPQIEQNQESDYEFLKKLAERNHYEFYVDENKNLRFGPPQDRGDGIVTLRWGESLLSFRPEANLAAQVSAVEVYGWDPQTKQPIVGRAVAGEESGHDPRRQSGGERVRAVLAKAPVLQLRQPVFTQAEARRRAEAILNDHAKRFVTGEAECIGLPDLRPDRNITLGNLGNPFSKTYYLQEATHKFDSGGYRTHVKVKETSL
jgi:phage protein D